MLASRVRRRVVEQQMYDMGRIEYRIPFHPLKHRKYNPLCRICPPSSPSPLLEHLLDSYACVPQPTAGELFETTIPVEASGGSFSDLFRKFSSDMRDDSDPTGDAGRETGLVGRAWLGPAAAAVLATGTGLTGRSALGRAKSGMAGHRAAAATGTGGVDETDVIQDLITRAMGRPAWEKGDAAPMESPSVRWPGVSFIGDCAIDGVSTEGETKGEGGDDDDDGDDVAHVPSDRVKTQDHRITTIASRKKAPAWLTHCQFWLTKAVSSIPAYVKHY